MDIFIIIAATVIIILLFIIHDRLTTIDKRVNKIREMAEMTEKQKYEYSLKIDDRKKWGKYVRAEFLTEEEEKRKQSDKEWAKERYNKDA